jgi:uncharacterized protein YndB with AHSA1/START domain
MMPQPTGRLIRRDDGVYVVLDRIVKAPIEDVWASLTRSVRLKTWIGEFTGLPSTGAVRFRMTAEENADWENVAILECEAPHRFAADVGPADHSWRVYWHLHEASSHTTLTFGQRLHSPKDEASVGVGWDYYLDRLLATRSGKPLPRWEDYSPDFLEHYQNLAREFEHELHRSRGPGPSFGSPSPTSPFFSAADDPGSSSAVPGAPSDDRSRRAAL